MACAGGQEAECARDAAAASDCASEDPVQLDSVSIGPELVRAQDTLQAKVELSGVLVEPGLSYDNAPVRYRWFVDAVETPGTADHLHGWKYFNKGEVVQLLVVTREGEQEAWSNSITVANTPPPAPGITLYPERPIAGVDALRCVVKGVGDFDEDELTYRIDWTRDGESWAARPPPPDDGGDPPDWDTGDLPPTPPPPPSEVPADVIAFGETWTCHVSAFDGTDWSPTVSASVVVQEPISG